MQSKRLKGAAFKPAPRRCPVRALLRVSRTQVLGLGVLSPLPTLTGAYLAGSEKQQSHQGRGSKRCQGRAAVPTKSSSTRASTWSIGSWACTWLPPVPTGCPSGPIMGHLQCAGHSSAPGRSQAPPVVSSVAETLGRRLRKVAGKQVTSGGSCERLPGGKGQGGHSREREQPHIRCRGAEVH